MKHTPGPWTATIYKGAFDQPLVNGGDGVIARVHSQNDREHEANAKLIAAAPDLLKALGDIMLKLQEHQMEDKKILHGYTLAANIDGMTELLNNAQTAYSKAI